MQTDQASERSDAGTSILPRTDRNRQAESVRSEAKAGWPWRGWGCGARGSSPLPRLSTEWPRARKALGRNVDDTNFRRALPTCEKRETGIGRDFATPCIIEVSATSPMRVAGKYMPHPTCLSVTCRAVAHRRECARRKGIRPSHGARPAGLLRENAGYDR
jgi:hypothetical protein